MLDSVFLVDVLSVAFLVVTFLVSCLDVEFLVVALVVFPSVLDVVLLEVVLSTFLVDVLSAVLFFSEEVLSEVVLSEVWFSLEVELVSLSCLFIDSSSLFDSTCLSSVDVVLFSEVADSVVDSSFVVDAFLF